MSKATISDPYPTLSDYVGFLEYDWLTDALFVLQVVEVYTDPSAPLKSLDELFRYHILHTSPCSNVGLIRNDYSAGKLLREIPLNRSISSLKPIYKYVRIVSICICRKIMPFSVSSPWTKEGSLCKRTCESKSRGRGNKSRGTSPRSSRG